MFRSRGSRLVQLLALTLATTVLFAGMATADNLQSDLNTSTGGQDKTVDRGTLSPNSPYTQSVFLFVDETSGATNNPTYPFTVSLGSGGFGATFTSVSITGAGTANGQTGTVGWTTPAAQSASETYDLVVSFDADTSINESPATITITFTIAAAPTDTTAPDTTIATHPADPTKLQTASFTYTSTEAGTFECALDGGSFASCPNAGTSYSGLAAGSHTFEVRAKDAANNVDASPASFTWVVDLTPPNTSVTAGPDAITNQTSAGFTYTSTESDSTFECSLDGATFAGCPAAGTSYSGLAAGAHTFEVRATDAAGNTDATPASHAWTIDLTPPAVSAPDLEAASDTGTSSVDDKTKDATPTLGGTAEPGSSFELLRGTDVVYTTTIPAAGTWSYTSSSLADGSYTFRGRATDPAGNAATSAGLTVLIDGTAPSVSASAKNADLSTYTAGTWTNQVVTVTFACTDSGSGVDSSSGPETLSSDGANQSSTGSCTDVAGNSASTTFSDIDIDRTVPTITLQSRTPANGNGWNNGSVTVVWSCADALSGATSSTASATKSAEGANQTASGTCTDNAGNPASDDETGINIDLTNPGISLTSRTPAANADGWNNSAVTVEWACSDALSGPAAPSVSDTKSAEGAAQTASGTCLDLAGNSASADQGGINIDLTAPTITFAGRTPANSNSWNNGDVEVTWNCADALSGVVSATVTNTTSTEGQNQTSTGTCHDKAGNSKSASVSDVSIDKTPPTITFSGRTPAANGYGWNNAAVTVEWTCTDALSGVESATVSDTLSSQGANQTASGTCSDLAGNTASAEVTGIDIDLTAPTITFDSRTPAANGNGWNNTAVTVEWTCTDALSGAEAATVSDTLSSDGANLTASGTCTDLAGNSANANVTGINIDSAGPTITLDSRTPANGNGWNNTDVTVVWDCADALSGPAAATVSDTKTAEADAQSASGTCYDLAGNSAGDTLTGIRIDKTAPSVAYVSATTSPNGNGWYNADVTATFQATDTLSGFDALGTPTKDDTATTSGEGSAVTVGSPAFTDQAGNTAASGTATSGAYKIDKTVPFDVVWTGGPAAGASYYFGSVPAAPTCSASDALSGYDHCDVTGYSSAVGSHTMTSTAHDKAGNSVQVARSYTVLAWTMRGFFQPVDMSGVWNIVKGGSTVPLKWEMFAGSTELTDIALVTSVTSALVSCTGGTEDVIEETASATGGTVLRYDSTGGQFIYNWQTPKQPGKCYRVTMLADDGSKIQALFKLK